MADDFLTVAETAAVLDVSTRHARRLADSGQITRVARGLVDRSSVERYVATQRQGRTRAWATHTAWGAVALLSDHDAPWLGASQTSRLRSSLREITVPDDLLTRMRDRSRVRCYVAHRAALPPLRDTVVTTDLETLGISDGGGTGVDGYVSEADLDGIVGGLGLRPDPAGDVVLRTTRLDADRLRLLVPTTAVAALDAATSTDPRLRGVGRRALQDLLAGIR